MTKNLVLKPRHFKKFVPKTRHLYIYLYKKTAFFLLAQEFRDITSIWQNLVLPTLYKNYSLDSRIRFIFAANFFLVYVYVGDLIEF